MLIVEDGTGVPDANSYASLEYAARYFGLNGNDLWFGGEPESAEGVLNLNQPNSGDTVSIGGITYKFVDELSTPDVANEILIGPSDVDTRDHFIAAINLSSGRGTNYSRTTVRNEWVRASVAGPTSVSVIAVAPGPTGNDITTRSTGIPTWEATNLSGGSQERDVVEQERALINATRYIEARFGARFGGYPTTNTQALSFPRTGINTSCSKGLVMPTGLVMATVEYAVRALENPLAPDPSVDASGYAVSRRRRKLGPIENEVEYAMGTGNPQGPANWKPYPIPDSMISCMVQGGLWARQSRVIRS